jgi:hypothetical protein
MKHLKRILPAVFMAGLCFGYFTAAAAEYDIAASAGVQQFIERIHMSDRVADRSDILTAKGHIIRWSDAFAGEATTADTNNVPTTLRIFVIPFATSTGAITASIIGGIIESGSGARIEEFIDIIDLGDRITDAKPNPSIIAPIHAPIAAISRNDIGDWIAADNRRAILDFIFRNISDHGIDERITEISIRTAFEKRGYTCAIPPRGFPLNSIWYVATCIQPIH